MDSGLFKRLGEEVAVEAATNLFYDKVIAEPELAQFFENIDVAKQRVKLRTFLTIATGGSHEENLQIMEKVHKPLRDNGLKPKHFDKWVHLLEETLLELNVPEELVEDVTEYTNSFRRVIVG